MLRIPLAKVLGGKDRVLGAIWEISLLDELNSGGQ